MVGKPGQGDHNERTSTKQHASALRFGIEQREGKECTKLQNLQVATVYIPRLRPTRLNSQGQLSMLKSMPIPKTFPTSPRESKIQPGPSRTKMHLQAFLPEIEPMK